MPLIEIETTIKAPIDRCFDLSRSIDLHKTSTAHTREEAVAGVTSGLIRLNETVTWRAQHFGVTQHLSTLITEFDRPRYFVDEMVQGAFKEFRHEHHFSQVDGITCMQDLFQYTSPLGLLGRLADLLVLKRYMKNLLIRRNAMIKHFAESERWKELLSE